MFGLYLIASISSNEEGQAHWGDLSRMFKVRLKSLLNLCTHFSTNRLHIGFRKVCVYFLNLGYHLYIQIYS